MAIPVVIDACSSLNLFASGRPIEIAKAAEVQLLVLPEVRGEAQHLFGIQDGDGNRPLEPVDWEGLIASGAASTVSLPEAAFPTFIELAEQLTDIDARCVALAVHLGAGLLSDDGKVRRVFAASSKSGLRSTVSVVRSAVTALSLDKRAVQSMFNRIRERARFEVPRRDPDFDWYRTQMAG